LAAWNEIMKDVSSRQQIPLPKPLSNVERGCQLVDGGEVKEKRQWQEAL
jgi:hypothetical protein